MFNVSIYGLPVCHLIEFILTFSRIVGYKYSANAHSKEYEICIQLDNDGNGIFYYYIFGVEKCRERERWEYAKSEKMQTIPKSWKIQKS